MKKLLLHFIIFALLALTAFSGFQLQQENTMHMMNGKLMSSKEMPNTGCHTKSCVLVTRAILVPAIVFLSNNIKEVMYAVVLLTFLIAASYFEPAKFRYSKFREHPYFLLGVPISVSSVIFRE